MQTKLVILDRDGTINQDSDDYVKSADEWTPLPGALEAADVSLYLGLPQLSQSQRPWQIQASNALSGEGVGQGLEWMVQVLETAKGSGGGSSAGAKR